MAKTKPKTITLDEFMARFTDEQLARIEEEVKYYDMLMQFRKAREEQGLTQEDLAKKANINRVTLSKVETGFRNATIETLTKIAQALGLNLELKLN